MNIPKIAVLIGSYFPNENWHFKNDRIHLPEWFSHFNEQTPNSNDYRFIISDGGSHPNIKEEIIKLRKDNVEVYLDGPHGEFYNFKYLVSKLKDEEYVLYIANDMIIRNIDHEDWIGKCIDLLNKYNPFATAIWSGGKIGTHPWDYESLLEPNVYRMRHISTQIILMKRETVNKIDWDYVDEKIQKSELGHWEAWLNERYNKPGDYLDNLCVTYNHDKLGCITLGSYSPEKLNTYKNSTNFFSHDY